MINFTRLRHMLAVDQAASFSTAAETIGITQSALTKSVAAVEEELGIALVDRRARRHRHRRAARFHRPRQADRG